MICNRNISLYALFFFFCHIVNGNDNPLSSPSSSFTHFPSLFFLYLISPPLFSCIILPLHLHCPSLHLFFSPLYQKLKEDLPTWQHSISKCKPHTSQMMLQYHLCIIKHWAVIRGMLIKMLHEDKADTYWIEEGEEKGWSLCNYEGCWTYVFEGLHVFGQPFIHVKMR